MLPYDAANARNVEGAPRMPADFDPYFKWLGIPLAEQPPNHYRLLAIPVFTSDPEVIENAADQRMAHLRSVQSGQRAGLAQALLNQIAMAKVCLLDHGQRAAYDQQLRLSQRLAESVSIIPPPVQVVVAPPSVVGGEYRPVAGSSRPSAAKRSSPMALELFKIIAGGVAGLTVGYLLICWVSPRNDFFNLLARTKPAIEESPPLIPTVEERVPARTSTPTSVKPVPARPATQVPSVPVVPKVEPPAAPLVVEASETIAEMQGRLEQRRDAAAIKGDLIEALNVVDELAKLNGTISLAAKLSFLSTWNAETAPSRRTVAAEMLKLLDLAVAEKQFDLTAQHVDRLLVLARTLDDRELERRATMIALKRPSEPSTGPKPEISPATMNTTPAPEPASPQLARPMPQTKRPASQAKPNVVWVLPEKSEDVLAKSWNLPKNASDWQIVNGGLRLPGRVRNLESAFSLAGDCEIIFSCNTAGWRGPSVKLFGESISLPPAEGGFPIHYDVQVVRNGTNLQVKVAFRKPGLNKSENTSFDVVLKKENSEAPTKLVFQWPADIEFTVSKLAITEASLVKD